MRAVALETNTFHCFSSIFSYSSDSVNDANDSQKLSSLIHIFSVSDSNNNYQ
jgi:hypothetical protein